MSAVEALLPSDPALPDEVDRGALDLALREVRESLAAAGVAVRSELLVVPPGHGVIRSAPVRVRFEVESPSGRPGAVGLALGRGAPTLSDSYSSDVAPEGAARRRYAAPPGAAGEWALLRTGVSRLVGRTAATNAEYAVLVDLARDASTTRRVIGGIGSHPDSVTRSRLHFAVRLHEVPRESVLEATALLAEVVAGTPVEWAIRRLPLGGGS